MEDFKTMMLAAWGRRRICKTLKLTHDEYKAMWNQWYEEKEKDTLVTRNQKAIDNMWATIEELIEIIKNEPNQEEKLRLEKNLDNLSEKYSKAFLYDEQQIKLENETDKTIA